MRLAQLGPAPAQVSAPVAPRHELVHLTAVALLQFAHLLMVAINAKVRAVIQDDGSSTVRLGTRCALAAVGTEIAGRVRARRGCAVTPKVRVKRMIFFNDYHNLLDIRIAAHTITAVLRARAHETARAAVFVIVGNVDALAATIGLAHCASGHSCVEGRHFTVSDGATVGQCANTNIPRTTASQPGHRHHTQRPDDVQSLPYAQIIIKPLICR